MHGKTLGFIADTLGYTEGTVKAKHKKILKKLSAVLPV
jgi:DNA-binding NarL/FixJ family response regulator